MLLIADSGSTKTHWVCLEGEDERRCTTEGLNPLLATDEAFATECSRVQAGLLSAKGTRVDEVFFYGAGCGQEASRQRVRQCLEKAFGCESVSVEGDLLGACRAACGTVEGLVGILGTGSNLCYYDGQAIAQQRTSTGYILGDEGSGNHIGKRLLKDYLEERMPEHVSTLFYNNYRMTTGQLLSNLYSHPYPNRYLASFATFAAQRQNDEYIAALLDDCFDAYFLQMGYFGSRRLLPLSLVGGIVNSFLPAIQRAAERHDVTLGVLMPDPMEGLVRYHVAHSH